MAELSFWTVAVILKHSNTWQRHYARNQRMLIEKITIKIMIKQTSTKWLFQSTTSQYTSQSFWKNPLPRQSANIFSFYIRYLSSKILCECWCVIEFGPSNGELLQLPAADGTNRSWCGARESRTAAAAAVAALASLDTVDPTSIILESLSQRHEEVDLVGRKRIFNKGLGKHSPEIRLNIADHFGLVVNATTIQHTMALIS